MEYVSMSSNLASHYFNVDSKVLMSLFDVICTCLHFLYLDLINVNELMWYQLLWFCVFVCMLFPTEIGAFIRSDPLHCSMKTYSYL